MNSTIAMFVADPKCSVQSCNGIMAALGSKYQFKLFSKNPLEPDFFNGVDMVCFPGGFGDSDSFYSLFKHNEQAILEFVARGGRYLGICMGAYWAGSHYFDILHDLDAVQYMRRPGTDTRRPHAKNIAITWRGQPEHMFWYDGCAITGQGNCQVLARYANNDAMAIIQGRIGLIGCHPESTPWWYEAYSYMRPHWHQGRHHRLLLEFVDQLMLPNYLTLHSASSTIQLCA